MYETFQLKKNGEIEITGYQWPVDDAKGVVCLIHGIGEHDGRYKRVAEAFNKAGFALVGMDLRGHGLSSGKRGDTAPRKEVLKDIDALIEYAKNQYPHIPIVLYGHSMGGNIALDYRNRGKYNDLMTGYIVSAPWLLLGNPPSKGALGLIKVLNKVVPTMLLSSKVDEKDLGFPSWVKPYHQDKLVHNKISVRCALEGFQIGEALAQGNHENNLASKDIPTLLLHGDADKICSIEGSKMFSKIDKGNLAFEPLPDFLHEIHNGNSKEDGHLAIDKMVTFIQGLLV